MAEKMKPDEAWVEYIGNTYKEGVHQKGIGLRHREFLLDRSRWLRRLGLDPNNSDHWLMENSQYQEIERQLESMRATGYPDTDLTTARSAIARNELLNYVKGFLSPND